MLHLLLGAALERLGNRFGIRDFQIYAIGLPIVIISLASLSNSTIGERAAIITLLATLCGFIFYVRGKSATKNDPLAEQRPSKASSHRMLKPIQKQDDAPEATVIRALLFSLQVALVWPIGCFIFLLMANSLGVLGLVFMAPLIGASWESSPDDMRYTPLAKTPHIRRLHVWWLRLCATTAFLIWLFAVLKALFG